MEDFKKLEEQLRRDNLLGCRDNGDGTRTYTSISYKGSVGDMAREWWTKEDYAKHQEYIETLKKDGTLGEPFISSITMQYNPLFDEPIFNKPALPKDSYKMIILDLNSNRNLPAIIKK